MLAILYDIHGNLPALEAVLADIDKLKPSAYLLGGDYSTPSPWPMETLELLKALPNTTWIRGNIERWLKDPPAEPAVMRQTYNDWLDKSRFPQKDIDWLYSLPSG